MESLCPTFTTTGTGIYCVSSPLAHASYNTAPQGQGLYRCLSYTQCLLIVLSNLSVECPFQALSTMVFAYRQRQ